MILPPPPRPPDPLARLQARFCDGPPPPAPPLLDLPAPTDLRGWTQHLVPSLSLLLPLGAILTVLTKTSKLSQRQRRLPAHEVVWLVIAQSWFPQRSLPQVWRHLHPSTDEPEPVASAFTQARQRLGAWPLQQLFRRTCRSLSRRGVVGVYHRGWLVVALDGSVFEVPDTPANRRALGSARNQHGLAAFPQLRVATLCEVGTHAITDAALGAYARSEQALGLKLLRRLPKGRLVLMDRGLSYYALVAAVRRRKSHVLARVKAQQRDLPVEQALPDGSYLSTIYPSSNHKRAKRGGLRVRVIRYTHDDPQRDGYGEAACLITTLLRVDQLTAWEAVRLYPWRWEEESVFAEIKETLLQNGTPLLRSKTPALVVQEVYGLLLGHYLVRQVMATALQQAGEPVAEVRLSLTGSLQALEDRLTDAAGPGWREGLWGEVRRQRLRAKRPRRYPRVKKATRSRWPPKKPGSKPPPQPVKHLSECIRILQTDGH